MILNVCKYREKNIQRDGQGNDNVYAYQPVIRYEIISKNKIHELFMHWKYIPTLVQFLNPKIHPQLDPQQDKWNCLSPLLALANFFSFFRGGFFPVEEGHLMRHMRLRAVFKFHAQRPREFRAKNSKDCVQQSIFGCARSV